MKTLPLIYSRFYLYCYALILLTIGVLVYLLFRPDNILIFDVLDCLGIKGWIDTVRASVQPSIFPQFVINSLPAGLWTASYLLMMYSNTRFHQKKTRLMICLPLPLSAIVLEFMQLAGWCPGTFDVYDLICYVIPILIFIKSI